MKEVYRSKYGYFNKDGKEFIIVDPKTPAPWFNYIWNGKLFGKVSHVGTGYSFLRTDRKIKLTQGRFIYIFDKNLKKYFSPTWFPTVNLNFENYKCTHGHGYTKIVSEIWGLRSEVVYFIPLDFDVEFWLLKVKNLTNTTRSLSIFAYSEPCIDYFEHPKTDSSDSLKVYFEPSLNSIVALERRLNFSQYHLFFASSAKVFGFDVNKENFIGRWRNLGNPEAVEKGSCSNFEKICDQPCFALQTDLMLEPDQQAEIAFFLIAVLGSNKIPYMKAKQIVEKFKNIQAINFELQKLKHRWESYLDNLCIDTPDGNLNLYTNVWNKIQSALVFDISTCSEDELRERAQSIFCELINNPKKVKNFILEISSLQLKDGSMPNYASPLWIPFVAIAYLKETGDLKFLNAQVKFSNGGKANVLQHMLKAIDFSLSNLTKRNLLKFKSSALDYVKVNSDGESILATMFLSNILRDMVELLNYIGLKKYVKKFAESYLKISYSINKFGFDKKWYIYGFKANREAIGSNKGKSAKFFADPQTWAIISGVADAEKAKQIVKSAKNFLLTPKGVRNLYPPFAKVDPEIEISILEPGTNENGAVVVRSSAWMYLAELILKNADEAYKLYQSMLPVANNSDAYKLEPYVFAEYIADVDDLYFANRSWITSSASWIFKATVEYMLGIKPTYAGLFIDPCVPSEWKKFSAVRKFRGARYEIEFFNPDGVNKVKEIWVNGKKIEGRIIPVLEKGSVCKVKVIMGEK